MLQVVSDSVLSLLPLIAIAFLQSSISQKNVAHFMYVSFMPLMSIVRLTRCIRYLIVVVVRHGVDYFSYLRFKRGS